MPKDYDIDLLLQQLAGVDKEDVNDYGHSVSYCGAEYITHNRDTKSIQIGATLYYEELIKLGEALKELTKDER